MKKITNFTLVNKLIVLVIIILLVLMVIGCGPSRSEQRYRQQRAVVVTPQRIQVIANTGFSSSTFTIVKVDGHEYLSAYNGGIIHLNSCTHEEDK